MTEWTPRDRVRDACVRVGEEELVRRCAKQLRGTPVPEDTLYAIGGPAAVSIIGGASGGRDGYWPRVWAARALLYVWRPSATSAIIDATTDASWRVREMCAKVVARHRVDEALEAMNALGDDPIPRVRQAAARAVVRLVEADP